MLQLFLQQLIPALEESIKLFVPLGILFAIILPLPYYNIKTNLERTLKWGFFLSLFIIAARIGTRSAINREIFESLAIVVALFGVLLIIYILLRGTPIHTLNSKEIKILNVGTITFTLGLCLYHTLEIWLIPVSIVRVALGDYLTLTFLSKVGGFMTGVLIGGLSGYLTYNASAALNHSRLVFVFSIQIAATVFQQIIFLLQVMMARQVLGAENLISVMAKLIDNQHLLIFIIYFVTILVPITLFLQPYPKRPIDFNPAQYRKILSDSIHNKRWGSALLGLLIIVISISSLGNWYANKKEELVPAIPIMDNAGIVEVPLQDVSDGHLHRYSYQSKKGNVVRFIIIQKGGSAYGVGLDACEICGPTGYFERDGQVICRLCDVVMNKATIGLPGGCNPIPLEYKIQGGKVQISTQILENESHRFR